MQICAPGIAVPCARRAGKPIELGPGTRCNPWVLGPANTPAITELPDAEKNVEIAVLSAIEHGRMGDIALAARIATTAIMARAKQKESQKEEQKATQRRECTSPSSC